MRNRKEEDFEILIDRKAYNYYDYNQDLNNEARRWKIEQRRLRGEVGYNYVHAGSAPCACGCSYEKALDNAYHMAKMDRSYSEIY